MTKSRF